MTPRKPKTHATLDPSVFVHAAGVAVLVVVTIGAYVGVIAPAHRARAEEAARAQQVAQDAQDLRVLDDHTLALERLTRSLEGRLIDTVELRTVDQLNRQVASVSELVEDQNLHVMQVDPGDSQVFARFTLVPIRVTGQGTFTDVVSFLHALHGQCKDTEVRAFAVHADPKASTDLVTFELSLAWYAVQGAPGVRAARPSNSAGGTGPAGSAVADVPETR